MAAFIATKRGDEDRGPLVSMNEREARTRLLTDGEVAWVYGPRRGELATVRIDAEVRDGDVFVRDMATGVIALVSVDRDGDPADGDSSAPAISADGRFVSYFSDRTGEYKLYIAAQDGLTPPRAIDLPEPTHYYTPSWSPDGRHLLFHDTHLRLWTVEAASGRSKMIGQDAWLVPERTLNPVWSPDSRWVAYSKRLPSL